MVQVLRQPQTGAFDVRIILTEEPAAFDASHIIVENGDK